MFEIAGHPHRRFNPLTGEWLLVSPHRARRPWQGLHEQPDLERRPVYDPACYLCPGNSRAGGERNPGYTSTFVFDNDFPALRPDVEAGSLRLEGLMIAESEAGVCRVVCFSPRHDLALSRMTLLEILPVVETWVEQYRDLGSMEKVQYVQIFENRGELMGCSNPHPHCQIWASQSIPNEPAREESAQKAFLAHRGLCLLCRYLEIELGIAERIVLENQSFVGLVPYWAVWPFEVLIVARRHLTGLDQFTSGERSDLADVLRRLTTRYDNLFSSPFPYSMGIHQRPTDARSHEEWHLHLHFYPPLLRSASVRKHMVGYEMLATPQRDIAPEFAASRLRDLPDRHYAEEGS